VPKRSPASVDSLLRDVISAALRDELEGLRRELAALRVEISRRPLTSASDRARAGAGRMAGRAGKRRGARGGQRKPGSLSAAQVKAIRGRLAVSQRRFAELAGVTPVAVYFWESGRTTPSLPKEKILLKLSKVGARKPARSAK
jgi:DNA-binding transcriptional regulator YiaG